MVRSCRPFCNLLLVCLSLATAIPAWAQGAHDAGKAPAPAPVTLTPAERAERRFPQPVRVGDLYDRQVLEPSDHQGVLGRVDKVVRTSDGHLQLVIRFGGVLGYSTRLIAVPIEAVTLLGQFMEIVDFDGAQLCGLPTFDGTGKTALAADDMIRVGLSRN